MPQPWPLRFGIFLPPIHKIGVNPTLALHRDLALVEHLDRLGFHEAWIGEHHSAGSELIASPEVFIATAAERTKHIKLGTGVNSLPYHHPFMLTDRIVAPPSPDPFHRRGGRAHQAHQAGHRGELAPLPPPVHACRPHRAARPPDPRSHDVRLRSRPAHHRRRHAGHRPAAAATPHGAGLRRDHAPVPRRDRHREDRLVHLRRGRAADAALLATSTSRWPRRCRRRARSWPAGTAPGCCRSPPPSPMAFQVLDYNYNVWQQEAELNGHAAPREKWRLMGPMHIADTVEQAKENCRHGLMWVFDYLSHIIPVGDPNEPAPSTLRRAGRLHERERPGRDRHAGDGRGPDRAAHRQDRRLRDLPVPRCRPGRLGRHAAPLRAGRRAGDAPLRRVAGAGADRLQPHDGRRHPLGRRHAQRPADGDRQTTRKSGPVATARVDPVAPAYLVGGQRR